MRANSDVLADAVEDGVIRVTSDGEEVQIAFGSGGSGMGLILGMPEAQGALVAGAMEAVAADTPEVARTWERWLMQRGYEVVSDDGPRADAVTSEDGDKNAVGETMSGSLMREEAESLVGLAFHLVTIWADEEVSDGVNSERKMLRHAIEAHAERYGTSAREALERVREVAADISDGRVRLEADGGLTIKEGSEECVTEETRRVVTSLSRKVPHASEILGRAREASEGMVGHSTAPVATRTEREHGGVMR